MKLTTRTESWTTKEPFRISSQTFSSIDTVLVELECGGIRGRGEGVSVFYLGETADKVVAQIDSVRAQVECEPSRDLLETLLPAGAARNAIDCALWDYEAKSAGQTIWDLLGLKPADLLTVFTIGIDEVDRMREKAAATREPMLKIKIDERQPFEQIRAVREGRPDARLLVDANQALDLSGLKRLVEQVRPLGVEMIEQPLPVGQDVGLADFHSPIPLCADESCLTWADVDEVATRYDMVNIKLDKTGGLTGALRLAERARGAGLDLMVGSMMGTSLAQAPTFVVGQYCKYVDIDGPLLLASDRPNPMTFNMGVVSPPAPALWG